MRLKRFHLVVAVLILAVFALPMQALAATAKETVEVQVNKVLKTLAEPAFKDQPRDVKITKIRSIVNEIFDYTELSKRTLGREWTKFNAPQQNEFVKLFGDLLEKTRADVIKLHGDVRLMELRIERYTGVLDLSARHQSLLF